MDIQESLTSVFDVCLILEGTYPYIVGGVSNWTHALLNGLPEMDFALVHLGSSSEEARNEQYYSTCGAPKTHLLAYTPPANLRYLQYVSLGQFDDPDDPATALPVALDLPQARIYHALATGFAGLLGTQIKTLTGRPLLLTEHGIYWREIKQGKGELECGFRVIDDTGDGAKLTTQRVHWTACFKQLARMIYDQADIIVTVCQANRAFQIEAGAIPSRCKVIPNGVNLRRFGAPGTRFLPRNRPYHVGLVGRVVPIKNVKCFILAARRVANQLPDVYFWVLGPTDHDPAYAAECHTLAQELGLLENDRLRFAGQVDPAAWYPRLDLLVLTSVSEGQPLVLLEGMAAGIPAVATRVGGCAELLQGGSDADRSLGPSGILVPQSNGEDSESKVAAAVVTILSNPNLYRAMSRAAWRRARRYYDISRSLQAYANIYRSLTLPQVGAGFQRKSTSQRLCRPASTANHNLQEGSL